MFLSGCLLKQLRLTLYNKKVYGQGVYINTILTPCTSSQAEPLAEIAVLSRRKGELALAMCAVRDASRLGANTLRSLHRNTAHGEARPLSRDARGALKGTPNAHGS